VSERIRAAALAVLAVLTVGAIALVGAAAVYLRSELELERRYALPPATSSFGIETGVGLIDRGRHLVTVVAQCTYCHGPDLAGREMADDPWIGRLHASNLTRGEGGIGARFSDASWAAALRHGVDPEGRSLLLMPSGELARLSDRDLAAIIAYVRQVPAVDRILPEKRTGWLTRIVVVLGLAPDLISAQQVAALSGTSGAAAPDASSPDAAAEYGEYLVALGSCRVCHRADLAGGLHPLSLPDEPVPPDLTPRGAIAGWTQADFARAMREGRTPDGRVLDREFMPWPTFAGLRDSEIEAIWRYLTSPGEPREPGAPESTTVAGRKVERSRS
jgi:mono/diheme cytochrome c family protein